MLRPDLCDQSNAYFVFKATITITDLNNNAYDKQLTFKNNTSFISCISKTNNTLIDNGEDLVIVMPMYNFIDFSKIYSKTTRILWYYYRNEPNIGIGGADNNINFSIKDSKSFDYKAGYKVTGQTERSNSERDVEIFVPLINCEINLILNWSKNCVLTSKTYREAVADDNTGLGINDPTNATFEITYSKLFQQLPYQLEMITNFQNN